MQDYRGRAGLLHLLDFVDVLRERRSRGNKRSSQLHSQISRSEIHDYRRGVRVVASISRSSIFCDAFLWTQKMRRARGAVACEIRGDLRATVEAPRPIPRASSEKDGKIDRICRTCWPHHLP